MNLPRKASLGLLTVAGAGLLLLPGLCSRSPEIQVAAQGPKKIEANPDDPRMQLAQLRDHIQQLKMELEKRQHEMMKRAEELEKAMHHMHQLEAAIGRGGAGGAGPFGPGGPGGGNIEQRLKQVEAKLDAVLEELRELRKGMKPGPKGGFDPRGPGPNPQPIPRPKADPAPPPPPLNPRPNPPAPPGPAQP